MYSALRVTLGHETLNQLVDLCGKGSHLLLLLPAAGAVELRSLLCLSSLLFLLLGKQQLSVLFLGQCILQWMGSKLTPQGYC